MTFHKKPLKRFDMPSLETRNIHTSGSNASQSQGLSHNLRYSKAFLSILQKQGGNNHNTAYDETEYKSFFNKTSTSAFNNTKNHTKTTFNQSKTSFHSNLFITTKNPTFSPKNSVFNNEKFSVHNNENERISISPFYRKPFTSSVKHRYHSYQKSTFLDEKVLTENFFLPFESKEQRVSNLKLEDNQNKIHSSSLNYILKAVTSPTLIKPPIIKPTLKPEDFQLFTRKFKLMKDVCDDTIGKKSMGNHLFKIKTMIGAPKRDPIQLSLKESIEKKLIRMKEKKSTCFNKIKKTILIIEDSLLDQIHHKTNMKYCYIDLPSFQDQSTEKSKEYFLILLKEISNKFNVNARNLYLYLKSGLPIKDLLDIPENEYTLIFSTSSNFQGMNNKQSVLYYQFFKTLKIISQLEIPLRNYNKLLGRADMGKDRTYEAKVREDYKDLIKNTVKLIEGEPLEENDGINVMKFSTKDEYFDEKNAQEALYESEKLRELNRIDRLYERTLKTIKFNKEELTDSSDEETQKLIRRQSQCSSLDINQDNYQEKTKQIAENLEEIMKKWLGQNYKGNDLDDDEHEGFDENAAIGKQEKSGKDFIEINKKRFMSKKRILEVLKKENQELFLQNIPKLMRKTSFTRSEMHSTYILYKVLQEITSQRYPNYSKLFIKVKQ